MAKAEAAELKAREARDLVAHEQAWREAARQWERAASREKNEGLRRTYADKAEAARANADAESPVVSREEETLPGVDPQRTKLLN